MNKDKKKIVIEFDNEIAAEYFAEWLCGSGEQHYWEYQQYRESEDDRNMISVIVFNYHDKKNKFDHRNIKTNCGRLDQEWGFFK